MWFPIADGGNANVSFLWLSVVVGSNVRMLCEVRSVVGGSSAEDNEIGAESGVVIVVMGKLVDGAANRLTAIVGKPGVIISGCIVNLLLLMILGACVNDGCTGPITVVRLE